MLIGRKRDLVPPPPKRTAQPDEREHIAVTADGDQEDAEHLDRWDISRR
jgi:hypothetical protein